MDIRNALNGYFEKTKVPEELDPHNVSSFVVPKLTEKRETQTSAQTEEDIVRTQAQSVSVPSYAPAEEKGGDEDAAVGASAFIKVVRYHKLTGAEFLKILGNSKISNSAYQEIESNPRLTVKRLIELLDESPLTSSDYERLIIAVQRMAELKEETKAKIKAEPPRVERESADALGSAGTVKRTESAAKEASENETAKKSGFTPAAYSETIASIYAATDDDDSDSDEGEYGTETVKKKAPFLSGKRKKIADHDEDDYEEEDEDEDNEDGGDEYAGKTRLGGAPRPRTVIDLGDDDDESGENDEDDEDDEDGEERGGFGRKRKGSNKGKIAAAAVGAVVLVGISFGIRYYTTGSLLPYAAHGDSRTEGKSVDEAGLFDLLSALPVPSPAFVSSTVYSAGGVREESPLKESVCKNKRLMYISKNKLYIYEQIGGQIAQLAVKDYGDKTLLGLMEAGDSIAVVSTGLSAPYSYSYAVPSESGADTVVTGTVERRETFIELADAFAPEKSSDKDAIRLSGTLSAVWLHEGRIIAVTWEGMEKNSAKEDHATFMPYVSGAEGTQLCAADKVFISSEPANGGFASIFSIDPDGGFDIAAAAGGSAQLVSKNGSDLFIGQGSTLIRYDLTEGVKENGFCGLSGEISSFSGISAQDGEVRVTLSEKTEEDEAPSAALTVLDGELSVLSEIKSIGRGETLSGTCFNGRETYIVTESGTCYGIDGENNVMSSGTVKITNENIYRYSDSIGIKLTATDDGSKRTGLTLSTVRLDGSLSVLYSLEISSRTVAVNARDEYLSSPAEKNVSYIGGSEESGVIVIPVVYFDGVSEVEQFVICRIGEDGILSVNGNITEYDRQSDDIFAAVDGDTVIAVTKGKIITAKAQDGAVQGYFLT
ncbi:MAG: beta-propeller domain-containing protein [Bacteroides sp.]|nr:beta-propeller domain-containing protein [Bacteroides sp.]